jgi:hypothetical protein
LIQRREGSEAGSTQSTVTCKHSARMSVDDSSPNGHKHNVQVTFEHCTGGNCKHTVKVAVDDASGKTYQHTLEITDTQNSSNKSQNEITADRDKVVAKSGEKANAALKPAAEWAITGVLDWDDVLSVPLVLARKPPAWLWFNEEERNTWDGNTDANPHRDLTEDELLIKAHFDQIMARADPTYMEDTYHRGVWLRALARFGLYGFGDGQDWKRYSGFVREWDEYYASTGLKVSEPSSGIEDSEDEGSEKVNGDIVDEDGREDSSSGEDMDGESA